MLSKERFLVREMPKIFLRRFPERGKCQKKFLRRFSECWKWQNCVIEDDEIRKNESEAFLNKFYGCSDFSRNLAKADNVIHFENP